MTLQEFVQMLCVRMRDSSDAAVMRERKLVAILEEEKADQRFASWKRRQLQLKGI